jgi:hypothetical protein
VKRYRCTVRAGKHIITSITASHLAQVIPRLQVSPPDTRIVIVNPSMSARPVGAERECGEETIREREGDEEKSLEMMVRMRGK